MARATASKGARSAHRYATSILLLAAQLLTMGHLAIVRHTLCPEHGEAIHVESPAGHETRPLTPACPTNGAAASSGAPLMAHGHEHCLACASTCERFALLTAAAALSGSGLEATIRRSPSLLDGPPPVAVLRLAPKNSPPSA